MSKEYVYIQCVKASFSASDIMLSAWFITFLITKAAE